MGDGAWMLREHGCFVRSLIRDVGWFDMLDI